MENSTLNIRSKRALLQLINKQLASIFDLKYNVSIKRLKKLKKGKVFQVQAQWIDEFVQKNFKDIPIVKHKFYKKKEIVKRRFEFFLYYLLLVFTLHQSASATYFYFRGANAPTYFLFINIYTFLIVVILLIGLYVHINYYPGLNIEKMQKSTKIPIFEYEYFLLMLKKKIENMSEKEINEMVMGNVSD